MKGRARGFSRLIVPPLASRAGFPGTRRRPRAPSLAPHADEPAEMAPAYTDLFLLNVYPYGTAFIDPSGELNGPAAWQAARRYENLGLWPAGAFRSWRARSRRPLPRGFSTSRKRRAGGPRVPFLSPGVGPDLLSCRRTGALRPSLLQGPGCGHANAPHGRTFRNLFRATLPRPRRAPRRAGPAGERGGRGGRSIAYRPLPPRAAARWSSFLSRARLGELARAAGMRLP